MSIVGPRPQMKVDFERFPEHVQRVIYNVRPGITGLGSIVFRDEERLLSQPGIDPAVFYTEKIAPYKGELESGTNSMLRYGWILTDLPDGLGDREAGK